MQIFFIVIAVATYLGVPVALLSGWIRWARSPRQKGIISLLSLTGFLLGTSSALLAVGLLVFSLLRGGFPYYDPLLLRIYRWGFLISLIALVVACTGIWRKNVLRWYAPALSLGTFTLWLIWANGE